MTQAALPAQAPRIQIVFACPKCSVQNIVPYDTQKLACKNCYQRIVTPIFQEEEPSKQNMQKGN